jgi:nitrite reductase (NADH) small subunit/3-phenylpropionate/trans-cinnamate dioxygenase ferredoxin subunit
VREEAVIMSDFTKVAEAKDLPAGKSTCVEFGGQKVALFNVEGTIYAMGDSCTHRGGPLSQGEVDGKVVTCPWHGATFDLTTGRATGPPASAAVKCYRVRVQNGEIQLAAP